MNLNSNQKFLTYSTYYRLKDIEYSPIVLGTLDNNSEDVQIRITELISERFFDYEDETIIIEAIQGDFIKITFEKEKE